MNNFLNKKTILILIVPILLLAIILLKQSSTQPSDKLTESTNNLVDEIANTSSNTPEVYDWSDCGGNAFWGSQYCKLDYFLRLDSENTEQLITKNVELLHLRGYKEDGNNDAVKVLNQETTYAGYPCITFFYSDTEEYDDYPIVKLCRANEKDQQEKQKAYSYAGAFINDYSGMHNETVLVRVEKTY